MINYSLFMNLIIIKNYLTYYLIYLIYTILINYFIIKHMKNFLMKINQITIL